MQHPIIPDIGVPLNTISKQHNSNNDQHACYVLAQTSLSSPYTMPFTVFPPRVTPAPAASLM